MKRFSTSLLAAVWIVLVSARVLTAAQPLVFEDVTEKAGLGILKTWSYGHAGAWGDLNGDGKPDLYIGAFANRDVPFAQPNPPLPNMLFLSDASGAFKLSPEKALQLVGLRASTTAAIFVDLDNDGDLDLYVSNLRPGMREAKEPLTANVLFENLGGGKWRDVTSAGGPWPGPSSTRNVAAYDFNKDGLLDLLIVDGSYSNWKSGGGKLTILENQGKLVFKDASAKYGLPPAGTAGMGLAMGDVNDDGVVDFFVADSNRLFVSTPQGKYVEVQAGYWTKAVEPREGHTCGCAFGDLNGDGLLDLVTSEHGQPSQFHVYINQGIKNGLPEFKNVTAETHLPQTPGTGKTHLPVKGAHIEILDMDNDGLMDVATAMIYQDERGQIQPVILRNAGVQDGVPQLVMPPVGSLVCYSAPGPMADYDRDGRVDIFLPSWGLFEKASIQSGVNDMPAYLFHNVTAGGAYLTVRVVGNPAKKLNPMGIGAVVRVYAAGKAGDAKSLLARKDIAVGTGYSSGEEALAHVGLGKAQTVDVVVSWQGLTVTQAGVATNQLLEVKFE